MPSPCFLRSKTRPSEQIIDSMVVLRVKLHCPACVNEVHKCLLSINGVIDVHVDANTSTITIRGKGLQPNKISRGIMRKMGRKSEILLTQGLTSNEGQLHNMNPISHHQPIETISTSTYNPLPPVTHDGAHGEGLQTNSQGTQLTPYEAHASQPHSTIVSQANTIVPVSSVYQQANQQWNDANTTIITPQESQQVAISTIATKPIPEDVGGTQVQIHTKDMPTNQVFHQYEQRRVGEGLESRIEIKQQIHTIVHGWPSHVPLPQSQYNGPITTVSYPPDYYICYPEFYYRGFLSDENPNSCKIM